MLFLGLFVCLQFFLILLICAKDVDEVDVIYTYVSSLYQYLLHSVDSASQWNARFQIAVKISKNEQFSAHDLIIPVPVCDTANGRFITQMTSSTSYEWRSLLMLLKIIAESLKPLIKKSLMSCSHKCLISQSNWMDIEKNGCAMECWFLQKCNIEQRTGSLVSLTNIWKNSINYKVGINSKYSLPSVFQKWISLFFCSQSFGHIFLILNGNICIIV